MFSDKQLKILTFPYKKKTAIICDGAIRSGKTSIMTISFIRWAMENFNNNKFAICGKTVDSAIKNIITPLLGVQFMQNNYGLSFSKIEKMLVVRRGDKTNYFEIFGGKDESSFQLIQGRTLAGVLLDEVALMPKSFVDQALARCSVKGSRFWFSCNPSHPEHWFYKEWITKVEEHDALYIHFELEDNPSLSQEIIERYHSLYTGVFYDRYIKGLWTSCEGSIYITFATKKNSIIISPEKIPRLSTINVGVDFGGNKSNHAFVATGITKNFDKMYVLGSESHKATGTDVNFIIRTLDSFCDKIVEDFGLIECIYCDSAEQAIINTLRTQSKYGKHIYNSIKNPIIDRIRTTEALFTQDRLFLNKDYTQDLQKGFNGAVWDDKKMDDTRLDNGTSNIDILDAFEYSFEKYIKALIYYNN